MEEEEVVNVESLSIDESSSSQPPNANGLLSVDGRYGIIRSVGEECIQEGELIELLKKKAEPICYDGFEPSGRMHIAQGAMKTINVNKLVSAGCRVKMWIGDWFAFLNNKMGGDLKKIEVVGKYFIEIWKAVGMDIDSGKVEFLWSSKEINAHSNEYWPLVMDIARKNKLPRLQRCCTIMGREDPDDLSGAQILYPCMQCADIFFLKADICQLGMDQRKVNMLAREYCDDIKRKHKPIILSHHMLPGLLQGQEKMSKSDTSSAIFMEDGEAEVNVKIKKAYCPPKIVEGNPCLEYVKHIALPWFKEFTVERKAKYGGPKTYQTFEELAADYEKESLHPGDVKPALAKALNKILQPVRDHFANDSSASELLKKVEGLGSSTQNSRFLEMGNIESSAGALQFETPARGLTLGGGSSTNQNVVDIENEDECNVDAKLGEAREEKEDNFQFHQSQQNLPALLTQTPVLQSPESIRAHNWSITETEALVSSYMSVSCNANSGTNQPKGGFWSKVVANYEEIREANEEEMPHERTPSSLRSHWGRLVKQINKWSGCYEEAKRKKNPGDNDDDVLRHAHKIYEKDHGARFMGEQSWKQLVNFPKWEEIVAKYVDRPRGRPIKLPSGESGTIGKRSREEVEGGDTPTSACVGIDHPVATEKANAMPKEKGKAVPCEVMECPQKYDDELYIMKRQSLEMERENHALKKRQLAMEEYRFYFEMMNTLRMNPNRGPVEDKMLVDLGNWFANNKLYRN